MAKSKKNTPRPFIIDEETLADPKVKDTVFVPTIDGELKGHGLLPRDLSIHPPEMFASPTDLVLIDPSEYDARIEEKERTQSTMRHLIDWPSLDQNGQGFCWAYSTGGALMALRRVMGLPEKRLSPHAVACKIKGFRDEGGWCGLSAKFAREVGYPSEEFWPQKSMSRSNDNEATWKEAAKNRVTEDWVDLSKSVYDQNLTERQVDTCSLLDIPMAWDFNWWSHSVFGCGLVKVEGGSYGRLMRNSWTDSWGDKGWSILRGSKARPDSAIAIRLATAA